jgi:N-acyl amino acid synthase of PEP-CTERM/exosortase system
MISNDIINQFFRHFRVVPAETIALLREAYRIRYEVYCRELGYERAEAHPDGMESDEHDRHSRHCLLQHRASGKFAGCVRLILQDPENPDALFPFESNCGHSLNRDIIDPARLPRDSFGEVSRLTVTAAFRRRAGEKHDPHGDVATRPSAAGADRRGFSHIAVGLYLAGAALGLRCGLSGVFVMMEPRLARHLQHYDIHFTPVGEIVDYHGRRGPFYISREHLLERLSPPLAGLLAQIRSELEHPSLRSDPVGQTGVLQQQAAK